MHRIKTINNGSLTFASLPAKHDTYWFVHADIVAHEIDEQKAVEFFTLGQVRAGQANVVDSTGIILHCWKEWMEVVDVDGYNWVR